MKSFGIISEVDKAGGVKLPDDLLRLCSVAAGDAMELQLEGNKVVMKKFPPACVFCGSLQDLHEYRNKSICSCCSDELRNY